MNRLFLVDYRENGKARHRAFTMFYSSRMPDEVVIEACRHVIGTQNELDSVFEVFADIGAKELQEMATKVNMLRLPHKMLYVNTDELRRCSDLLNEKAGN